MTDLERAVDAEVRRSPGIEWRYLAQRLKVEDHDPLARGAVDHLVALGRVRFERACLWPLNPPVTFSSAELRRDGERPIIDGLPVDWGRVDRVVIRLTVADYGKAVVHQWVLQDVVPFLHPGGRVVVEVTA